MQQTDPLWILLAREITGDASAEEKKALQELIADDPVKQNLVDKIICFCEMNTTEDSHEIKNAWNKHVQRLS